MIAQVGATQEMGVRGGTAGTRTQLPKARRVVQVCRRAEAKAEEENVDADAVDSVEANAERDDKPYVGVQKAGSVQQVT